MLCCKKLQNSRTGRTSRMTWFDLPLLLECLLQGRLLHRGDVHCFIRLLCHPQATGTGLSLPHFEAHRNPSPLPLLLYGMTMSFLPSLPARLNIASCHRLLMGVFAFYCSKKIQVMRRLRSVSSLVSIPSALPCLLL